jgi:signal transduction histidine kinase
LLEYAKAGAEGDQNVLEPVDLSGMLRQIVRRFQPTAERKRLALTLHEPAGGAADELMMTDRLKLERVVGNLVDNALKYTVQGGVTIEWKPFNTGGAGERGGEEGFSVTVTDTGIGVPPQNVKRLFDEFYQVNNHERDRSKGFGMGLAICRSLARQLGGDVRLVPRGEGAVGSRFEVTVAAVRAGRRGRPHGAPGDHADSQEAGLCPV